MYLLSCPNCQAELDVTPAQAGDSIECQKCQVSVEIPKLGELRKLPQSSQVAAEENSGARPVGSTIGFVVCSLITVASLLGAGYNAVRWAMIETTTTTESHLEMIETEYMKVGPASMVVEFEDMETNSLDLMTPYRYQMTVDEKNKWGWNASVAGGMALVFGIGAVIAASYGRKD